MYFFKLETFGPFIGFVLTGLLFLFLSILQSCEVLCLTFLFLLAEVSFYRNGILSNVCTFKLGKKILIINSLRIGKRVCIFLLGRVSPNTSNKNLNLIR